MKQAISLVLGLVILTGCTPDIRTTRFQDLPPKPEGEPIKIYQYKSPQCDFEEVGIVNSRQRNKLIPMEEVVSSLRVEARKMGGDAIIGLSETSPISNVSTQYGVDRDPVLSGTVIRFVDPDCRK